MHMMLKCPACGTKVLASAEKCPQCAALIKPYAKEEPGPLPSLPRRKIWPYILGAVLVIAAAAAVFFLFLGGADTPRDAMENLFSAISARNWDDAVDWASASVRDNPANAAAAKKRLLSAFGDAAPVSYEITAETLRPEKKSATLKVRFAFKNKSVTMEEEYDFVQEGASWQWMPRLDGENK